MVVLLFNCRESAIWTNNPCDKYPSITRKDCITVLFQCDKDASKIEKFFSDIKTLRKEWGYQKVTIIPCNHLSGLNMVCKEAMWKAYYQILEHFRKDRHVILLEYKEEGYKMSLIVDERRGCVQNCRYYYNSEKSSTDGIQWKCWFTNKVQILIGAPAEKPAGIEPESLRAQDPNELLQLESLTGTAITFFFQVLNACSDSDVKAFCQTVFCINERLGGNKNVFLCSFGHLNQYADDWRKTKTVSLQIAEKVKQMGEKIGVTVKHSHYGYHKELYITGIPFLSGIINSRKMEVETTVEHARTTPILHPVVKQIEHDAQKKKEKGVKRQAYFKSENCEKKRDST